MASPFNVSSSASTKGTTPPVMAPLVAIRSRGPPRPTAKQTPPPRLYRAEVIYPNGPWRNLEEVEFATLKWVDWFNHRRLLKPIGNIPPAEFEALYYAKKESPTREVGLN